MPEGLSYWVPGMAKLKVQVWIYGRDPENWEFRFLILQTTIKRGAFWQPVTGGVKGGESLQAAASREAKEETGLTFMHPPVALDYSFEYEKNGKAFKEDAFFLEVDFKAENKPFSVQLDPHEHGAYEWVSAEFAEKKVKFESNLKALKLLLTRLGVPRE